MKYRIQYTYDDLDRLTKVGYDDGLKIGFTYDEAGNRLSRWITYDDLPDKEMTRDTSNSQRVSSSDVVGTFRCTTCGEKMGKGQKFCMSCGTPSTAGEASAKTIFCTECGSPLDADATFCTACGTRVE